MTVFKHELRQGRIAFCIWTAVIGTLLAVCVFLFPEMKGEMDAVGDLFSSMGAFTAAFGMDQLNFGTLIGYYAIECGNVLGLGGAFYAAVCAVNMLSKEEINHSADFLFTHPVSRQNVLFQKLLAVLVFVTAMNLAILALSVGSMAVVGEAIPWKELLLLHLAYYLLHQEIACICFGVSAFLRRGSIAIGIGIAVMLYFLNIVANLTESASFLKYVTPFAYCDGAEIVQKLRLDSGKLLIGAAVSVAGILAARLYYPKKDLFV